jgi:hypothetical protein
MNAYAIVAEGASPPCALGGVIQTTETMSEQVQAGTCIEVATDVSQNTHYFAGGWAVTARSALPAPDKTSITADGIDAATWSDLPEGASVVVRALTGAVQSTVVGDDGVFSFTSDAAGTFTITISSEPAYLEQEVTVGAN